MRREFSPCGIALAVLSLGTGSLAAQTKATIAQFMSPPSPLELTAAKKTDRVAWMTYERGMRNVYTAAAPDFRPLRITRFLEDDGTDVSDVSLSDDGRIAVFVRGSAPNRVGWIANPSHDPGGAERAIWAARTDGSGAWRIVAGAAPELSPDGRFVLYVKDGQIYRGRVTAAPTPDSIDRGLKPFIKAWGTQSSPRWSPDGLRVAFVSNRVDHSFIGIYDTRTHAVDFVSPGVDFDLNPTWSPDGKQIAFIRCPGQAFGEQTQQTAGGIGNPPPVAQAQGRTGCGGFGFGGGGGAATQAAQDSAQARAARQPPGLYRGMFQGGYTLALMVADVASCTTPRAREQHADGGCGPSREVWHNQPGDRLFTSIARMMWANDHIVFPLSPASDEYDRYYAINLSRPGVPMMLTTTNGLIEDATSAALSPDGKTLYYATNANDLEKRHIWAVPTSGGTPRQVSANEGIETAPQPLASGRQVAVLYFNAAQPASVGLVPASCAAESGGCAKTRVIYPKLDKEFPVSAHVTPEIVWTKASDGVAVSNQLFLPKDLKPGEKRPAMVFVHGGPMRQMLPGYHYMQFYHWAYGINQWLADQGYIVLSINYRSGIGYGRSFRFPDSTNQRGNSEYRDVLAGGLYLKSRPDVDPARIGIWGLSYGGLLTSQALARNSDLFVAGADLAGVHRYGNSLDSTNLAYRSSAISAIDTWKSPVFLVHGDDDRNVAFSQTVGLVQLLRARNIYHELIVIPDDLHESMLHSRWIDTWNRMGEFLKRFVWKKEVATGGM